MFFLWICFQYLVIHESYWYMWLVQDDDEQTIDEEEALITEVERNEELAALQAEADLPLEDVLKTYKKETEGDLLQWFFFYPLSYVDRNNAMHFLTVGTQKIIWSVEYFSASRESSPDSKGINSNLDSKNLIVGEITQNLHSIKTDYFEVFSFAFLVIGVDFFFPFSDASSQANGCDHEPSDSSSDEGNSSEEGDDGHSYAEFVKKNYVHFAFCVTDDGVILFYFWGCTLPVKSSLMPCLTLQGKSNGSMSTVDGQACSNLTVFLWFFLFILLSCSPITA
jgi:hypothetical protein